LEKAIAEKRKIISQKKIDKIFSIVEQLTGVHSKLLEELEQRISQWSESQTIGDIFIKNVHRIKETPLVLFVLVLKGLSNNRLIRCGRTLNM